MLPSICLLGSGQQPEAVLVQGRGGEATRETPLFTVGPSPGHLPARELESARSGHVFTQGAEGVQLALDLGGSRNLWGTAALQSQQGAQGSDTAQEGLPGERGSQGPRLSPVPSRSDRVSGAAAGGSQGSLSCHASVPDCSLHWDWTPFVSRWAHWGHRGLCPEAAGRSTLVTCS